MRRRGGGGGGMMMCGGFPLLLQKCVTNVRKQPLLLSSLYTVKFISEIYEVVKRRRPMLSKVASQEYQVLFLLRFFCQAITNMILLGVIALLKENRTSTRVNVYYISYTCTSFEMFL